MLDKYPKSDKEENPLNPTNQLREGNNKGKSKG
jgi:hypothetical protein